MKYANVFSSFADRHLDLEQAIWQTLSTQSERSLLWRNWQRNMGVCEVGGIDGLERTTKAEASKIKKWRFFLFLWTWKKSNSFHMSALYIPKQTNMLFVHSAVCLQDKRAFTPVYNYADLIVIIIKWLHRSFFFSLCVSFPSWKPLFWMFWYECNHDTTLSY